VLQGELDAMIVNKFISCAKIHGKDIIGGIFFMKRMIVFVIGVMILLSACSSDSADYTIIELEANTGGKSTARVYTDDVSEKNINAIVKDLRMNDLFGSGSIHVWIHEPPSEGSEEFGKLVATAKYAHTVAGKAQVGVEETGKVYIEFE